MVVMWSILLTVFCILASVLKIKMMGCLSKDDCNKTTIVTFPANKTLYKMTHSCCDENYCNRATQGLMASFTLVALAIARLFSFIL